MVVEIAILLAAALAGGAVGAALGARNALGLTGAVIVLGETLVATSGEDALDGIEVLPAPVDAVGLTAAVGVGPLFGPHVAFAGGAAAAAYEGRKRTIDTGFRYHQAKQIAAPLYDSPRALVVGAISGLLGAGIAGLVGFLGAPLDPIALAVLVSALLHRLVFGYPMLGRLGSHNPLLDMSRFEAGEYWGDEDHETSQGIGGRHLVEPWQPEFDEWPAVVAIGAGVGLVAGGLAIATDSVFLAFGLAAAVLPAREWAAVPIPATYHVALPAGIAAVAFEGSAAGSIAVALILGIVAAIVAELAGRLLYAHGDTHLDPGFASILLTSILIVALVAAGIFDAGPVPYPTV